ncbi:MAG: peptidase S41 [Bacteroidota bacterium]|nr:peptidase S41 [Bacteroidota bacterium]
MRNKGLLCLLFFLTGLGSAFSQTVSKTKHLPKYAASVLRDDFQLLRKILEANHPSLYWYTPKDSMDYFFDQTLNSLTDSLDEVQFKNKVGWVVSKIRCGHTTVRFSRRFTKNSSGYRYPSFPLYLKAWNDSLVVLANLLPGDSTLKRGTIITGINGYSNRALLDTLFRFIGSDGYAFNYKNQVVSGNFPAWYKTIIGLDSVYTIQYVDSTGKNAIARLSNYMPPTQKDTGLQNKSRQIQPRPGRKMRLQNLRNLVIDTSLHTAFMHLSTFSGGGLRSFFRRSFKTLSKLSITNLVIDLRENGGGKVTSSVLLGRYLSDHPFKVGDTIAAISRKFHYGRYIHPSILYWLGMNFGAHKESDGLIHFRRYETKFFQPDKKFHFDGQVILVQGGYSFSAATMFIAELKGQKNVIIAGEESGGGYYGNSAMYLPTIRLPHTGLRIDLPMYRLVMDKNRPKGRGIEPDLLIPPSSFAIRKGFDPKMQVIKEWIREGRLGKTPDTRKPG